MIMMSFGSWACSKPGFDADQVPDPVLDLAVSADGPETVVLAGGCFWCTEAVFEQLDGVADVVSGYAGGDQKTADYRAVSSGMTDHAEVIRVTYDPLRISFGQVLKVFFTVAHDPTQLNRQGPDAGRQYRSAIFCQTQEQKKVAQAYIRQLDETNLLGGPIVTVIEDLGHFYPAEAYHQDFVRLNPDHPYVRQQALPKIQKVRHWFAKQLKNKPRP